MGWQELVGGVAVLKILLKLTYGIIVAIVPESCQSGVTSVVTIN